MMKNVNIAYIGGGSKAWAQILLKDLLLQDKLCGTVKLYDIDQEAARKNQVVLKKLAAMVNVKSEWQIEVYDSLETVLPESDFIVLSILPGTFEDMTKDVHHSEEYGIWQSVGDTVGPGGYRRATRLFEAYIPIAKAIQEYAPETWVINYTNPMTLSLKLLYSIYPEIKAVGCCHEVFGTQKLLAKAYKDMSGYEQEIDRHDIHVNVQGINHFTWINEATYKGVDLLPYYEAYVEKNSEAGSLSEGQSVTEKDVDYFASLDKVKMDLFKRFGVVAAAGDRHLAEFMAEDYLSTPKVARNDWGFDLTPVSWRIENDANLIAKRESIITDDISVELNASDEEGANIMIALAGVTPFVTNANFPNQGQAPDLPLGAIVETNIAFSGDMAKPLMAGPMDSQVAQLVKAHVDVQETFTKAWLENDADAMFRAFSDEPSIKRLTRETIKKLYDDLMQ